MGCFMVCHKCQHENGPPTDVEVLDGTYQCRNCEYPLGHSITYGDVYQGLVERIEKLEEMCAKPKPKPEEPKDQGEYVMVKTSTVLYLLGEEGDFERPDHAGPFWWRTILRNSIKFPESNTWIDCADQLPTEEDADFEGKVWVENGHETFRLPYTAVVRAYNDNPSMKRYWMRTGLQAPTAPDYKEKS